MSLFKDCKFIGKKHHIWCSVWSEQLLALGIIVCNCYLYYYYAVYNMVYISYWKYHCNTLKAQMPEDALALPMLFILYCMVCTISIPPFWGYSTIWTSKRRLKIWVKIPALAFFCAFYHFSSNSISALMHGASARDLGKCTQACALLWVHVAKRCFLPNPSSRSLRRFSCAAQQAEPQVPGPPVGVAREQWDVGPCWLNPPQL